MLTGSKIYFYHICALLVLLVLPAGLKGQDYNFPYTGTQYDNQSPFGMNPFETEDDEDTIPRDSTKRKIRKPLESYFFDDSTRVRPNFAWNIDTYRNKIQLIDIDTSLYNYSVNYDFQRRGVGAAYQGPLGGAVTPLDFFDRAHYRNFKFAEAYDPYFFTPENAPFFNVKLPFTRFEYYWAGQKTKQEENFRITHAQSISPSSGFNIDYKSRGTRGIYQWQKTRAKNLSLGVHHTGKKYSVHAGYIYNAQLNRENGGLRDDRDLTDSIYELPANMPVNLRDAQVTLKNNTYYVTQSYGVPLRKLTEDDFSIADQSSIFFGHTFQYHRWAREYTDTRGGSHYQENDIWYEYYPHWYIDPTTTRDSISETLLSNRLFVQLQPWDRDGIVGIIDAGVGMDNHRYKQFIPSDYLKGKTRPVDKTDIYMYGSVEGKFRKYFDWGGDVSFHPAGDRSGDISVGGNASVSAFVRGNPIILSGKFKYERSAPDYWSGTYFSNHFVWSNSFSKENETRFEVSLGIPSVAFDLRLSQSVMTNRLYYDENCLPVQSDGNVSVTGLYASKDFTFGGVHLNHRVLLQWSTSDKVVPVPLGSAFISYYYEFWMVRNVLRMQLGADGWYNTKYYAYGFNPSGSVLYNQREKEIGGYPMLDVFVTAKWKRMRILLKMQHLNDDMFGQRNYFQLLHYPLNKRVFKLGFSWAFYD